METNQQTISQTGAVHGIEKFLASKPIILQILRFIAIGVINTALDFIVLNVVSKTLHVTSGLQLGGVNIIGFTLAVVQSYLWNRYWAFGNAQSVSLWQNFWRLAVVGALGAAAVLAVLFGSNFSAPVSFYAVVLVVFIALEVAFWYAFGLEKNPPAEQAAGQFLAFIFVSIIGLFINSLLIALITSHVQLVANPDLNKNLAKVLATLLSLVWNFIGYKIFVFKK